MYYFVGMTQRVRHLYYCPFSGADIVSYMREFGVRVLSVILLAAIANGKRPVPSHFLRKRLKQLSPQLIRRSLPSFVTVYIWYKAHHWFWQHHYKKCIRALRMT